MNRLIIFLISTLLLFSCGTKPEFKPEVVNQAIENGKQANEGFARSLKFVEGWLDQNRQCHWLDSNKPNKSF